MNWIRQRALNGELIIGTFLNLASSFTAEIAAYSGFDWLVIDLEHGIGDELSLALQFQALAGSPTTPLVRIAWNDPIRFKRVLDSGAAGVMVPYVSTPAEAQAAVNAMRYPPVGIRGVSRSTRASGYGQNANAYIEAATQMLTILQIETPGAVESIDQIAAIDGVDVCFIGPLDLSIGLGIPQQYNHPTFRQAAQKVAAACRKAGKAAGIHAIKAEQIPTLIDEGFTFLGMGTESTMIAAGFKGLADSFSKYKERQPVHGKS